MAHIIAFFFYKEKRKFDEYSLFVSGVTNINKSLFCKIFSSQYKKNICFHIFSECMLHNVCHL